MKTVLPPWWTYVKHILTEYPALCGELEEKKNPHITAKYKEYIKGKGLISRPVEQLVTVELSPNKQKKYEAVTKAILLTREMYPENAENRLKIIEWVYFTKEYTVNGAAMQIPCHLNTASRWQADFIRLVADILQLP